MFWKFSETFSLGTREQAFVYALTSAAIVHGVAKGCVNGAIPYCPCGPKPMSDDGPDFKV